jgi:hypothetical protein
VNPTLSVPLYELMRLAINGNPQVYGQWSMGAFNAMITHLQKHAADLRLVQFDGKNYEEAKKWADNQFGSHMGEWYVISLGLFLFRNDTAATAFKIRWG